MENYIKTKEELTERVEYLKVLKRSLTLSNEVVKTEKKRIRKELEFLQSEKKWNFNFESGGWNQVFAKTRDVAIKRAIKKYNCKISKVNIESFRVATYEDTKMLMSMFY
tara:strand:+ start:687 stop:1013 length:327 start_codon:yes stop_codon:yes gene_type:complete